MLVVMIAGGDDDDDGVFVDLEQLCAVNCLHFEHLRPGNLQLGVQPFHGFPLAPHAGQLGREVLHGA